MLTLEEIKNRLADRNLKAVAERAGVSYFTVRRASEGGDIKYTAAKALSDYLAA